MMKIRDKNQRKDRKNISWDSFVPKDHIIQKIDNALDLSFDPKCGLFITDCDKNNFILDFHKYRIKQDTCHSKSN